MLPPGLCPEGLFVTYYQQPPQGQYPQPYPGYAYGYGYPQPLQHSGLGIASTVLAIVAGIGLLACFVLVCVAAARNPAFLENVETLEDPNWVKNDTDGTMRMALAGGCGMFLMMFLALLGMVLGLIGVFSSTRKRAFAFVGLALNGLMVAGIILMMIASALA